MVAFQRQEEIGPVGDDLRGDLDLRAHGVDRHEGAVELAHLGEMIEKLGNSGDLVGLLGHAELSQGEARVRRIGAERVLGLQPLTPVMGATRGLAPHPEPVEGRWR